MSQKKYASLSSLQTFLENLRDTFSALSHKHTISDITDYTVDTELSSTSTNPIQNKVINEEFEAVAIAMGSLETAIDGKSDSTHTHDDCYYTESEIDTKISAVNTSIANITSGSTVVPKADEANHATSADSATTASSCTGNAATATKATQDGNGNVITDTYETKADSQAKVDEALVYANSTYETKTDASAKLTEAKSYADSVANTVKNDLLNGAGTAYDTLKELGDLIDENVDAIEALETVAAGKADKVHTHAISDVTELQTALDTLTENKSDKTHTHADATTTASGMMSAADKVKLDGIEENATNGIQRINMTSEDGVAFTATIDGVEELVAGMTFLFIPDRTTSSTTLTLNVNGLGDVAIRRKLSSGTATLSLPVVTTQLYQNRPTLLMYDTAMPNGTPYWIPLEFSKPVASDLYGKVPVQNGGWYTNANTTDDDLIEAREAFGVYSKADHEWTQIYDSGEITESVNAFANIDISGYRKLRVVVKTINDGSNSSAKNGAVTFTATNGTTYQFPLWTTMFTNNDYDTGCMAQFEINDGWLVCPNASRILRVSSFLSDSEGGTADNLTLTGSGIMKCTNTLSTMMISALDQDTSYFYNAGSRAMVWGCNA